MDIANTVYEYLMLNLSIEWVVKFLVAYFFIIWIATLIWVIRDITNRTSSIFIQILSVIIILIFTPLWIFLYLLIRPWRTLFEKYYDEVEWNLGCLTNEIESRLCSKMQQDKTKSKINKVIAKKNINNSKKNNKIKT